MAFLYFNKNPIINRDNSTTKESFQENIELRTKQFKLLNNINQQELSALSNFEKSNMSRLEARNTKPSTYTLLKIAKSLKIEVKKILTF